MILTVVVAGIAALLWLVLKVRMPAFLALLLVSMGVGLATGMTPTDLLASIQAGMGGTLGFVAVVVGLGALLGSLLEHSGGVGVIATSLLSRSGMDKAPWALTLVGFLVAIPVFFDVAFIILVPMLYSLARSSGRSLLYFAMPVLAGLMVTHAFIPPTPGPVAVAELLGADLGWVIVFGALCGLPAAIVAGPLFSRRFAALPVEDFLAGTDSGIADDTTVPGFSLRTALLIITLPLGLILLATISDQVLEASFLQRLLAFVGHPFSALMLATVLAWGLLMKAGWQRERLHSMMAGALEPAGIVVLVTGAGGVFKQVLTDSGAGQVLAESLAGMSIGPYAFAFLVALVVRVAQGSATVAMITAAGLAAPLQQVLGLDTIQSALMVTAIAAGATSTSHVNDSGFWLVSRYLQLDEAGTLKSWTVVSTIAGFTGFVMVMLVSLVL
jgi:Gnt-I system low-affinity gluconate transporter